ncbi:hypothetical protein KAU87_05475 [Candidatus Bathyarchaeota archaeon]|nr:hypothetical protein [Candidatus Bathyarchaeota archaeon]
MIKRNSPIITPIETIRYVTKTPSTTCGLLEGAGKKRDNDCKPSENAKTKMKTRRADHTITMKDKIVFGLFPLLT